MTDKKLPTVKEFFDLRAPTLFTDTWDMALFNRLSDEYSELTGTGKLWHIAFSTTEGEYRLEERLAAFDQCNDIKGIDKTDRLYTELRAVVIDMAERYKGTE